MPNEKDTVLSAVFYHSVEARVINFQDGVASKVLAGVLGGFQKRGCFRPIYADVFCGIGAESGGPGRRTCPARNVSFDGIDLRSDALVIVCIVQAYGLYAGISYIVTVNRISEHCALISR